MVLSGEKAGAHWQWERDGDFPSSSWTVEMPPSHVHARICAGEYYEMDDQAAVNMCILSMRRRKENNSDETVVLSNIDDFGPRHTLAEDKVTSITFAMSVHNCWATCVWTIGFWK